jgi:hypothetical protein
VCRDGAVEGVFSAFLLLDMGRLARDLVSPGEVVLGKLCLGDGFRFIFLDLLNDFSGCWVLDHRYLGKFLLAEGVVGCLFDF